MIPSVQEIYNYITNHQDEKYNRVCIHIAETWHMTMSQADKLMKLWSASVKEFTDYYNEVKPHIDEVKGGYYQHDFKQLK